MLLFVPSSHPCSSECCDDQLNPPGTRPASSTPTAGANGIRRSLGRTGICYDDAVAESFFATHKKELIHTRPWPGVRDLTTRTKDWIDNYYTTRRHSTLGCSTPDEYELGYRDIHQLAA